jgi:hypothetical protein
VNLGIAVDWFLLAVAAYWIGQIIFVVEMRAEHPDWLIIPCGLIAMAWPYLTVRRSIAIWRASRGR